MAPGMFATSVRNHCSSHMRHVSDRTSRGLRGREMRSPLSARQAPGLARPAGADAAESPIEAVGRAAGLEARARRANPGPPGLARSGLASGGGLAVAEVPQERRFHASEAPT